MIADLRFIERDGKKILQMKRAEFQGDASGAICGHTVYDWEEVAFLAQPDTTQKESI